MINKCTQIPRQGCRSCGFQASFPDQGYRNHLQTKLSLTGLLYYTGVLDKGVGPSTGPHKGLIGFLSSSLPLAHTGSFMLRVWPQHTLGTSSLHIKQPRAEDDVICWELSRASWYS